MLVYQNTFVSPDRRAPHCRPTTPSHHFTIENNLFVGPASPPGHVVDWSAPIDDGTFDYNGWYPDGFFDFNHVGKWTSFAAMQAAGPFEAHGRVLSPPTFASGLVAPSSYKPLMEPPDATLAAGTNARDAALVLPNVNDGYTGSAPDLGALERGCPIPIYGVRPVGIDETNEPYGCGGPTVVVPPPVTLIQTTALTLKDPSPTARKFSFKATTKTDPAPERVIAPVAGSATDPTLAGATLTIYNASGQWREGRHCVAGVALVVREEGLYVREPGGAISSVVLAADALTITRWRRAVRLRADGIRRRAASRSGSTSAPARVGARRHRRSRRASRVPRRRSDHATCSSRRRRRPPHRRVPRCPDGGLSPEAAGPTEPGSRSTNDARADRRGTEPVADVVERGIE